MRTFPWIRQSQVFCIFIQWHFIPGFFLRGFLYVRGRRNRSRSQHLNLRQFVVNVLLFCLVTIWPLDVELLQAPLLTPQLARTGSMKHRHSNLLPVRTQLGSIALAVARTISKHSQQANQNRIWKNCFSNSENKLLSTKTSFASNWFGLFPYF